ncbi:hypothetical protein C8R47DRAFT_1193923 [Mycena vitilis]|nr:hypothetical protein C8R47DRAFT_1193923 [Mycena vitilis]
MSRRATVEVIEDERDSPPRDTPALRPNEPLLVPYSELVAFDLSLPLPQPSPLGVPPVLPQQLSPPMPEPLFLPGSDTDDSPPPSPSVQPSFTVSSVLNTSPNNCSIHCPPHERPVTYLLHQSTVCPSTVLPFDGPTSDRILTISEHVNMNPFVNAPSMSHVVLSPGVVSEHSVTVSHLNKWYEFKGLLRDLGSGDQPQASLALRCTNIAALACGYHYLNAHALQLIACAHNMPAFSRKSQILPALQHHICLPSCPGPPKILVFHRLKRARGILPVHTLSFCNDAEDSSPGFTSSYTLNQGYSFLKCGPSDGLSRTSTPPGSHKLLLCRTPRISAFVECYLFLTVPDLQQIATEHNLPALHRKQNLVAALMTHTCDAACTSDGLLFRLTDDERQQPYAKRTMPTTVPDEPTRLESVIVLPRSGSVQFNRKFSERRTGLSVRFSEPSER